MDSEFMCEIARFLGEMGVLVFRFEFPYMAARRVDGSKKPPPRAEKLMSNYEEVIKDVTVRVAPAAKLFIGGKSMGGRVASLVAEDAFAAGRIAGLVCLGYPFHPSGKPERLRTAHLEHLEMPTLVCQGERDALGNRDEVRGYALSASIELSWLPDGDHSLVPRKATGRTKGDNWQQCAEAIAAFMQSV